MYYLNLLQYFFARPWRYFFMTPGQAAAWWYGLLRVPLLLPLSTVLYVANTPLRFANAVLYNVLLYNVATLYDRLAEVIVPRRGAIRHAQGSHYAWLWATGLLWRVAKHGLAIGLALFESILMTLFETLFPTLTLYHGTSSRAAIHITQKGLWWVGDGNFAGSGLYFAVNKRAAQHYARWAEDPVLIKARVTLGYPFPLACAPAQIRGALYGHDGDLILDWGRKNLIGSVEWWRHDTQWWEYALLAPRHTYVKTWRIRVLYVESRRNGHMKRVWGGKSLWVNNILN